MMVFFGVIGSWIMWWGAVMGIIGAFGFLAEQFLGVEVVLPSFYLISILGGTVGVVFYEGKHLVRSALVWRKAGGDDHIRKVILFGKRHKPRCWSLAIDPQPTHQCTDLFLGAHSEFVRFVVARDTKANSKLLELDHLRINFDSLLTNLIYRRKLNEFIKIRESLS